MSSENDFYFSLLKNAVAAVFLKEHTAPTSIEEWKGEEIALFQEDLFAKVKARVSEKWFYSYFKNNAEKLPRIDMLNLLSTYVGFSNWNAFKNKHKSQVQIVTKTKRIKYWFFGVIIITVSFWFFLKDTQNEFHFCFVDELQNKPIEIPLNIKIINRNESPISFKTDSLGCFSHRTTSDYITFVVKSPYHKTDTIVRYIETSTYQSVQLISDDYALMLQFYVDGNIKDWKKHKNKLENLIADEAVIYQFHSNNIGVELYSKQDFIGKLTIPTSSLQRIKILERTFEDGKITKLKFIVL